MRSKGLSLRLIDHVSKTGEIEISPSSARPFVRVTIIFVPNAGISFNFLVAVSPRQYTRKLFWTLDKTKHIFQVFRILFC